MQNFIATAASRETSTEIMEAIASIAQTEEEAVRIWSNPTETELHHITEYVTKNGLHDPADFCWGANGKSWAA